MNETIVNLKDDMIAYLFLKIINRVKVGGLIFIPESTYQYTPNRRKSAEALIKVLGLEIIMPLHNFNRMIIASKEDFKH